MSEDSGRGGSPRTSKLSFFQRFGLFFYHRPQTAYVLWATAVIFGLLSYTVLIKKQGFPNVDVPVTVINGTYFAADERRMDREVTHPASKIISQLPDVKKVSAVAGDNFFTLRVDFKEGETTSRAGTTEVQGALRGELPEGVQLSYKPLDAAKYAEQSDLLVSIYNTHGNIQALEQKAKDVATILATRDGVARANVLKQFETGVNPTTGQVTTEQRSFDRLVIRENGHMQAHEAVTIGVAAAPDKDALELSDEVKQTLTKLAQLPEYQDIQMHISADLAEGIKTQLGSLQENLLQGLIVVLLGSLLLISWRVSLTGAIAMITVLLITVAILQLIGFTLNTVTLFALILSLGLMVDDTTIMVEAIDAAKRESRSKRTIVARAIKQVARASTAGTFTTMLGFAPMLFVGGVLGEFIRVLPVTILISLAISLVVSLGLVPFLSSIIVLRREPKSIQNPLANIQQKMADGLARLLLEGKRSRTKRTIAATAGFALALIMVLASFPLFRHLTFDIFPATKDTDTLSVSLRFAPETDIRQAAVIADRANEQIVNTLDDNLRRISYQTSGSATNATATVNLISYKDREATSQQLIQQLEKDFEGFPAAVKVNQVDVGPPREDLPFRTQVTSEDRDKALRLASDIRLFLEGREVARSGGATARITRAEIALPSQIMRVNAGQIIEVRAGFNATDTSALVSSTQDAVEAQFPPERIRSYGLVPSVVGFDFGAESGNQESFQTMLYAFPFLILAMYLLMAAQFRSWLQPLLIFIAVPFSFFGVALGLTLTDNPLSFFVLVGFFALIGVVVNNTILLVDFANQAREWGLSRTESIAIAIHRRFRALITTSFTAVIGLIPLALSDPFWESISVTLIFGLLSSTFLVVISFPYLYLAGEGLRIFGHRLWRRKLPRHIQHIGDAFIAPIRVAHMVLHIVFRRPME